MNINLNDNESGKIWTPASLNNLLWRDTELFEVFIGKNEKAAINTFLNALIPGYFEKYKLELAKQDAGIRSLLNEYIQDKSALNRIVEKLITEDHTADHHDLKQKSIPISFKPRGRAIAINAEIEQAASGMNMSRSGYYKNMLLSYSRKPMYERERLVYHEEAEKIINALKNKKKQELIFTSRDNPHVIHTVLPYRLAHGTDEQFNYLIGQEMVGRKCVACSYRLRRIIISGTQSAQSTLDPQIREYLDLMLYYDPQYAINEHTETCIEFTEKGLKDFRRIYTGRPKLEAEEGSRTKYHTFCSQEQVINYFKRFNPGEAYILSPEKLRTTLSGYHKKHLDALQMTSAPES